MHVQYQDRINLDEKTFFYTPKEEKCLFGEVEFRPLTTVQEPDMPSSATYVGEWLKLAGEDVRQGYGTLQRPDRSSYTGYFIDNQFSGKGKYTFPVDDQINRKQYIGAFKNGLFHGLGTMTWLNGDSCKALWVKNVMQTGIYTWNNSTKARVLNEKNQGELTFYPRLVYPPDDFRLEYRGALKDGHIPDGKGVLVLKKMKEGKNLI